MVKIFGPALWITYFSLNNINRMPGYKHKLFYITRHSEVQNFVQYKTANLSYHGYTKLALMVTILLTTKLNNLLLSVDVNHDGIYDPTVGDYPAYDLKGTNPSKCDGKFFKTILVMLLVWWVFNDEANIHSETNGISYRA